MYKIDLNLTEKFLSKITREEAMEANVKQEEKPSYIQLTYRKDLSNEIQG